MLDDGHITDSLGRKINFKNCLIIMTSNIGVKKLQDFGTGVGFKSNTSDAVQEEYRREVLKKEFLKPLNISAYKLCMDINVSQTRISEIIKGNRSITADTALRLSKYFGNSANFWLGLQNDFDIEDEMIQKGAELKLIKKYSEK